MKTTRTHAQPSALSAKPNKAQTITLNWARAMEDFHRCYQQVEATISSLQAKRYSFAVEFKNVENAQMTLQALLAASYVYVWRTGIADDGSGRNRREGNRLIKSQSVDHPYPVSFGYQPAGEEQTPDAGPKIVLEAGEVAVTR